jgi:hypothetical protein
VARREPPRVGPDRGAQAAPDTITGHRTAHRSSDRVRDARRPSRNEGEPAQLESTGASEPGPGQGLERRTVADAPDQAPSRFRPRLRRARSTARPPRVRIRTRNPWVFFRLRVLGWNVRFTTRLRAACLWRRRSDPGSWTEGRQWGSRWSRAPRRTAGVYGRAPTRRNARGSCGSSGRVVRSAPSPVARPRPRRALPAEAQPRQAGQLLEDEAVGRAHRSPHLWT